MLPVADVISVSSREQLHRKGFETVFVPVASKVVAIVDNDFREGLSITLDRAGLVT